MNVPEEAAAKKRRPNWTEEEKCVLLEHYKKRQHILQARFDPNVTQNKKQKAWEEIAAAINSRGLTKRSFCLS